VAIAAIEPQLSGVMLVAERHRLLPRDIHVRIPGRQLNFIEREPEQGKNEHAAIDA
jgi:hypothetical protein